MNNNQDNEIKLVITGNYSILVKVWASFTLQREYLKTNHEEADVVVIVVVCFSRSQVLQEADAITVHHLFRIASGASDDSCIKVVCDDTDIFVLLINFYLEKQITMNVSMVCTAVIFEIGKHLSYCPQV